MDEKWVYEDVQKISHHQQGSEVSFKFEASGLRFWGSKFEIQEVCKSGTLKGFGIWAVSCGLAYRHAGDVFYPFVLYHIESKRMICCLSRHKTL